MFAMELANMIVYGVMAVCAIAMIWAWKSSNTKPGLKPLTYVFAVGIFACLIVNTVVLKAANSEDKRLDRNVTRIQTAKAAKVVEYIENKWREGKVIFLVTQSMVEDESESDYSNLYAMREIMRRLSEAGIAYEEEPLVIKPGQKKNAQGYIEMDSPSDPVLMNKALRPYVGDKVDVCVNFVGLPEVKGDTDKITYLTKKSTAKKGNMIVMGDAGLASIDKKYIESGRVTFIFEDSHGNDFDLMKQEAPKDLYSTFDQFYSLVDADTLSSFVNDNPDYFPVEEQ